MKIFELREADQPREKMLAKGASALSNTELLAILLRTGSRRESVLDLARRLLDLGNDRLGNLFSMSLSRLEKEPGIGPGKATSIVAAAELGRRFFREESGADRKAVVSARIAYEMMIPEMKGLQHEECWVLFLNGHNYLISKMLISKGGGNSTTIDITRIVREALDRNASGIVLIHNHPSGDPEPSKADMKQTEALHKACSSLQISLLDHVVFADASFYSFADERTYCR